MFRELLVQNDQSLNKHKRREVLRGHHILDLYINDASHLLNIKDYQQDHNDDLDDMTNLEEFQSFLPNSVA